MKGIIVFVKNPEIGKVKTRLAISMGDKKAFEIYNKLVGYTRDVLGQLTNIEKYIYYSSFIDLDDDWKNDDFQKRLQSEGGLGVRMTQAFNETLETCDQVLIIGSDCPQLTPSHINLAFEKLINHDIVIGPSSDGGYYLLGMSKMYQKLFQNLEWSTNTVFTETIQKAQNLGLSIAELDVLSDIDYEEDWIKFGF